MLATLRSCLNLFLSRFYIYFSCILLSTACHVTHAKNSQFTAVKNLDGSAFLSMPLSNLADNNVAERIIPIIMYLLQGDVVDDDSDDDGVENAQDECPDTPEATVVNEVGCGPGQLDSDGDGITDDVDPDRDGDGVDNEHDLFPDDGTLWSCLVGDDCPPHRIISNEVKCPKARTNTAGNPVDLLSACTSRAVAFNQPEVQIQFVSSGQIKFGNGLCLEGREAGAVISDPLLIECNDNDESQIWSINDEGQILSRFGECLVGVDNVLTLVSCSSHPDPSWGFVPINPHEPYNVQVVYATAIGSIRTDRANLWQQAAAQNQTQWSDDGTTWDLAQEPITLTYDDMTCADMRLTGLASLRNKTIRDLSLEKQFSYNTKYLSIIECTPTGGVANALETISVYDGFIIDNIELQIQIDPNNATDGEMSEVGVIGHELGHSFGLPHENCIVGGYQGGINEEGADIVLGRTIVQTRGPMCNGAFYPNVDPITQSQRALLYERSCNWIEECDAPLREFGSDGRPYGCGIAQRFQGMQLINNIVIWDTSDSNRTFTVYKFTFSQGNVSSVSGLAANAYDDVTSGETAYYAVSLDGESAPEKRQYCGFANP